MSKQKVLVPKVRFKGFESDWEKDYLKNIAVFVQGIQVPIDEQSMQPFENSIRFLRIENFTQDSKDYRYISSALVKKNFFTSEDIAIVRYGATAGFIGYGLEGVLANNLFKVEIDVSQITSLYLSIYLRTSKVFDFFQLNMFGGAMPALNFGIVGQLMIPLCSIKEQTQIGDFFQKIDELIALQQEALTTAQDYKKSMLQKMFPKKGEKVPRIRFAGFSGDWENMSLGKKIKTYGFREYLSEVVEKGIYPIIQQGDKPIIGFSNKPPFKNYTDVVLFGDHTLSLYKPNKPFLVATDGVKILYIEGFNRDFTYFLLENYMPVSEGYKRHFSILKNQVVFFPNLQEQQKIGAFFQKLDEQIAEREQKLENYQLLKKAMLQRMFI